MKGPRPAGHWVRRGMRLVYTGPYDASVPGPLHYPPGMAVTVHRSKGTVTVRLATTEELYADWPLEHVEKAP